MAQVADTDWYRSEVDAQRMRNVTLFCGGNSVVMFNSTMQQSVTNFCDRIGMESRTNKNGYNGVTNLMNDVRYTLCPEREREIRFTVRVQRPDEGQQSDRI